MIIFANFQNFQKLKIWDSSLIAMHNLHVFLKTKQFYPKNCTRHDDSRAPLFFTENGRTWRHSDVIYGRRIRGFENSFGQGV